jgi:uncharacterized spore protein YtfJ
MVGDFVGCILPNATLAATMNMGVATSAIHSHRVEEEGNGKGQSGSIHHKPVAVLWLEQGGDVSVPEVLAIPHLPIEAFEH